MKRALTIQNIMDKKYETLELTGEFGEAFGTPERTGVWFVWGRSGNGKTRFVMQLCKELTKFGKGLYLSIEEGSGLSFANALKDTGISEVGRKLLVVEPEYGDAEGLISDLTARMKRQRSPMFVVIDSFQYTGLTFKQYMQLRKLMKNKLLIFTSQADGKLPVGRTAKSVMFDADQKIWVEGHTAFSKGRYIGRNGGSYVVWKEGAERYWDKIDN